MKRDSVRSAVSALTLIIAVNVWIQCSIANSEPSALSGRCQKTDEKEKSIGRRRDREIGRKENQNIWESGDKRHRNTGIRRLGDGIKKEIRKQENEETIWCRSGLQTRNTDTVTLFLRGGDWEITRWSDAEKEDRYLGAIGTEKPSLPKEILV